MPRITLLLLCLSLGCFAEQSAAQEDLRFFETKVRPLLAEHCYRCHGEKKQRGELRLDARDAILRGGVNGPAALAGKPQQSLLIKAVRQVDPDLKMPPEGKLTERQVADLERWIQLGLPYPATPVATKKDDPTRHWAFAAPAAPQLPTVKDTAWPHSPLDHFILAGLEAKGLRPAPPAEPRTLLRRLYFDLIGLPPSVAEVDEFVARMSANPQAAVAEVVERLLASPHYGERWGRHWLDVARYADSNGLDENVAYGNAWRYRDYVVDAFNRDLPYDQFLLEQLAGDLLPGADAGSRQRRLIATGFLALGPKVLAEVDERKMEMDIIDEQIDTVGRAILGLTLGCARCHDHKFDPLSMHDYYGLAGIFKSTRTMEHFKKIARWHENSLASPAEEAQKAEHDAQLARLKEALSKATQQADQPQEVKRLRTELVKLEKSAPEFPSALGVADTDVLDVPLHIRGNHLKLGDVVPRRVPTTLAGTSPPSFDTRHSGRLELARWLVRPDHPLTSRVMVNRIWRWHFGHGLVRSPDNFGRLGDVPVHQPLLDWLARRFVSSGWSIKDLHRLIVRSSTYQLSSAGDVHAAQVDPENRLHGRAEVRRLEAEALRDALLAVSGQLDRRMGGSLLHVRNRAYLFDHTSKDATRYDSNRRSLYLPVIRNNTYDVFQLFDFPDPAVTSGDRATTTVAPQALFMLNSDWLLRQCDDLAGRLLESGAADRDRVETLYRAAYGRPATAAEKERALRLLARLEDALAAAATRKLQAWSALCQVVLSANEFVYVR